MYQQIDVLPSDVIRLLVNKNPKQIQSKSNLRFSCYYDGITFVEYKNVVMRQLGSAEAKKCKADLKWDCHPTRNFIRIERNGKTVA